MCLALCLALHMSCLVNCSQQGYKVAPFLPLSRSEVIRKLSEVQGSNLLELTELTMGHARAHTQIYPVLKLMGFVGQFPTFSASATPGAPAFPKSSHLFMSCLSFLCRKFWSASSLRHTKTHLRNNFYIKVLMIYGLSTPPGPPF